MIKRVAEKTEKTTRQLFESSVSGSSIREYSSTRSSPTVVPVPGSTKFTSVSIIYGV